MTVGSGVGARLGSAVEVTIGCNVTAALPAVGLGMAVMVGAAVVAVGVMVGLGVLVAVRLGTGAG